MYSISPLYFAAINSATSLKLTGLLVPRSYIPDGLSLLRTTSTISPTQIKSLRYLPEPSKSFSLPVSFICFVNLCTGLA